MKIIAAEPSDEAQLVFLQVRPIEPPYQGWPQIAGGWVTVAQDGSLGGWTVELDPTSLMTLASAKRHMEAWIDEHKDPKKPWQYRILHEKLVGTFPKPKKAKPKPRVVDKHCGWCGTMGMVASGCPKCGRKKRRAKR